MKLRIIIFLIFACHLHLYGQAGLRNLDDYTALDTAILKLTYTCKIIPDIEKPDFVVEDTQELLVGHKISKYYSRLLLDNARLCDSLGKKGAQSVPSPPMGASKSELYKNYPIGSITAINLGNIPNVNYRYDDKVQFDWQLHYDFVEISGYRCQKATTSFRGRGYTAWFTMEIPISDGPWKFGGLPGLILKVTDSESHYDFECIGIEQTTEPIRYYNLKYTEITRKDLQKLLIRMTRDFAAFLDSMGYMYLDEKGNIAKHSPPMPYNPIERE